MYIFLLLWHFCSLCLIAFVCLITVKLWKSEGIINAHPNQKDLRVHFFLLSLLVFILHCCLLLKRRRWTYLTIKWLNRWTNGISRFSAKTSAINQSPSSRLVSPSFITFREVSLLRFQFVRVLCLWWLGKNQPSRDIPSGKIYFM